MSYGCVELNLCKCLFWYVLHRSTAQPQPTNNQPRRQTCSTAETVEQALLFVGWVGVSTPPGHDNVGGFPLPNDGIDPSIMGSRRHVAIVGQEH